MINFLANHVPVDSGIYWLPRILGRIICVGVPKDYTPSGKCIFHFHGLRRSYRDQDTDDHLFPGFKFLDAMPKDTLFIAPLGAREPSAYSLARDYKTCTTIIKQLADIGKTTGDSTWNNMTFSAHSAGGQVLHPLLQGGTLSLPVKQVFLFDATYDPNVSVYNQWLMDKSHRLWSVARSDDEVFSHSAHIMGSNAKILKSDNSDHYDLVRAYFPRFISQL